MVNPMSAFAGLASRPARGSQVRDAPAQPARRPPRHTLPSLSCIIPCYNEATNLGLLLPQLAQTLSNCASAWEVIVVDDGSNDDTASVAHRWTQRRGFRLLTLSRNFGKESALTAGLRAAGGDVVVPIDADLQHPPALIPQFVEQWQAGYDVVYALRRDRQDESLIKRLGVRLFYRLVTGRSQRFRIPAGAGDFRLMDRRAVDALLSMPERNRFMKGLYAWVGFDSVAVPYTPQPRAEGRSKFSLMRLARLSLDGLTAFTNWPLRAVSVSGFVLAVLALGYGGYLIVSYLLYGHAVSGWTTIAVTLMLFAGIQLLSLGIVGEYIARIFEEVKGRPLYIVKQQFGQGLPASSAELHALPADPREVQEVD